MHFLLAKLDGVGRMVGGGLFQKLKYETFDVKTWNQFHVCIKVDVESSTTQVRGLWCYFIAHKMLFT